MLLARFNSRKLLSALTAAQSGEISHQIVLCLDLEPTSCRHILLTAWNKLCACQQSPAILFKDCHNGHYHLLVEAGYHIFQLDISS